MNFHTLSEHNMLAFVQSISQAVLEWRFGFAPMDRLDDDGFSATMFSALYGNDLLTILHGDRGYVLYRVGKSGYSEVIAGPVQGENAGELRHLFLIARKSYRRWLLEAKDKLEQMEPNAGLSLRTLLECIDIHQVANNIACERAYPIDTSSAIGEKLFFEKLQHFYVAVRRKFRDIMASDYSKAFDIPMYEPEFWDMSPDDKKGYLELVAFNLFFDME